MMRLKRSDMTIVLHDDMTTVSYSRLFNMIIWQLWLVWRLSDMMIIGYDDCLIWRRLTHTMIWWSDDHRIWWWSNIVIWRLSDHMTSQDQSSRRRRLWRSSYISECDDINSARWSGIQMRQSDCHEVGLTGKSVTVLHTVRTKANRRVGMILASFSAWYPRLSFYDVNKCRTIIKQIMRAFKV